MRCAPTVRPSSPHVRGIGLSGQMHGAVLLDAAGAVLRPCILWNDVRAAAECRELEAAFPICTRSPAISRCPASLRPSCSGCAGTSRDVFARTAHVLLPKAWIRYRLTGEMIEEMSDASGTLWLDVGRRDWSAGGAGGDLAVARGHAARWWKAALRPASCGPSWRRAGACGATCCWPAAPATMPPARSGLGAIRPGDAFVSLGTSGVLWATTGRFAPYPQAAVHAFCHAVPGLWHQMGVTLSAAASLAWWARVTGAAEAALLAELPPFRAPSPALFLPYLSGERTPHNDGAIRGGFAGLSHDTGPRGADPGGAGRRRILHPRLPGLPGRFGHAHRRRPT